MMITYLSTADAKEEFVELINRVSHNKECVMLTRRGHDVAAVVPVEDFLLLLKTHHKKELEEATEALQEARNKGTMTLHDLKEKMD